MIGKRERLLSFIIVLISLHTTAFSQMRTVKGMIVDETLAPMLAVSIATQDQQYSTLTDNVGHYSLQVPVRYDTVRVRMVGMKTELIPLIATLTTANRILFNDDEEGYTYSPKVMRKLQRQEVKRKSALYKKAEKLFNK